MWGVNPVIHGSVVLDIAGNQQHLLQLFRKDNLSHSGAGQMIELVPTAGQKLLDPPENIDWSSGPQPWLHTGITQKTLKKVDADSHPWRF